MAYLGYGLTSLQWRECFLWCLLHCLPITHGCVSAVVSGCDDTLGLWVVTWGWRQSRQMWCLPWSAEGSGLGVPFFLLKCISLFYCVSYSQPCLSICMSKYILSYYKLLLFQWNGHFSWLWNPIWVGNSISGCFGGSVKGCIGSDMVDNHWSKLKEWPFPL